jgi:hypothetical protein
MLLRTIAAAALDYAPLPGGVVEKVSVKLRSLTVQGKPVDVDSSR